MAADNPFPLPDRLSADLERVRAYWNDLRRGENTMPFWDDVRLGALPGLTDKLMLIDVFADPERFRINTVAGEGTAWRGKFIDEAPLSGTLHFLRAQASATVEARAPTFYQDGGVSRLLLPLWGDGRINMLLGALD